MSYRAEPTVVMWQYLWRYSVGRRARVVLYATLCVIANVLSALTPLVIAWLLNTIQLEGLANPWKLAGIVLLIPGLNALFWLFHGPSRVIENEHAFYVRANFRQFLLEGVLALPSSWHTSHHSGDTIDKINKSSEGLFRFSKNSFLVIEFIVRFLTALIALAYFNFNSVIVALVFCALGVWTILQYDKKLVPEYHEINKGENKISAVIYDTVSNITTVTILRIHSLVGKRLWGAAFEPFKVYKRSIIRTEYKWGLASMVSVSMIAGVLLAYIWGEASAGGVIMIGTVYALFGYADRISALFFRFAGLYTEIVTQKAALDNVETIVDEFPSSRMQPHQPLGNWNYIEIKNLSFAYQDATDELHLKNASVSISRGEKIAFIGESGSGKSTFLKLLQGLYEPQSVAVYVDGVPASIGAVAGASGLIPQDPELFQLSIRENITLGADIDQTTLDRVVRVAAFEATLRKLPRGYESTINEKGVNLSGGERQRLALARGLLAAKDADLLLLDEPTSSVDAATERAIYTAILKTYRSRTVISTLHRLHLLPEFDIIYVFKRGRIVSSGTFAELKRSSPEFQRLWKKYHGTKPVV